MSMIPSRWVTSLAILAAIFPVKSTFDDEDKGADSCIHKSQNVGTVLFHGGDIHRRCWEDCSYLLLQARWIAQTLIPEGKVNIANEAYIDAFISYVESTLQITRCMAKGLAQQMMVDVLADVHGGYLRATLLPLTREAFYAGTVRYGEANKLFVLYEKLKSLLDTDGSGWKHTLPSNLRQRIVVRPLDLEGSAKQRCDTACEDFITYEKCRETKNREDTNRTTTCKPCVHPCNDESHINKTFCPKEATCCASTSIVIPIPFLDDNRHPHSIAVPLRPLSLHSLFTAKSQSLVTKYYKTAMRCLLARNSTKQELLEFNRQFRRWLVSAVLPHLNEETWYPAFGSVMRIVETMRGMGFERVDQEMLMPSINEPPKVNSIRTLLKAARLEGQGSWKGLKTVKQTPCHRNVRTTTCKSGDDDEERAVGRSAVEIEVTEKSSGNAPVHFQPTESGNHVTSNFPEHQIQTVYSDLEPRTIQSQGKSNQVNSKLPRSSMDVLMCIILGMLGTLLLWMMCACCYCLITRMRGKPEKRGYPKGDRSESKTYYGTTDNRSSYPPVQPVAYEYYDPRSMRPYEVSGHPTYAPSWNQPVCAPDPYQEPSTCRIIMMPPPPQPPPPQEAPMRERPEPPPPPPPPPPLPPPPRPPPPPEPPDDSKPYHRSQSYREHEPDEMELEMEDPHDIRRPPSIRKQPKPKSVQHASKMDYPSRISAGKSLGTIASLQSITSPRASGQHLGTPKRGDSEVSIPPSLMGGDETTEMKRTPPTYASNQARQSSMYRGRRKTLPQQVKSPRISNMPLGSW